jgi:hypothetical protein
VPPVATRCRSMARRSAVSWSSRYRSRNGVLGNGGRYAPTPEDER